MPPDWSTDSHDTPAGGDDAPPIARDSVASPGDDGAPQVDPEPPAPEQGTSPAAELSADGEGEMHRSAVDAVDGLLDEVELALARLDDGTYGRCEECGATIDDGRLAAQPIARTCESCHPDRGTDAGGPSGIPVAEDGIVGAVGPGVH
jgi:RNA polymerase-binding transcription factor DksA